MAKQKIAVIGGGVGAITAVYAITQTPDWNKKFDITIYQLGWRTGGKGASGRNAELGQRIEEHGLHVWAGFYDNAFRNMRRCYEQLVELGLRKESDPLGTMDKAFKPLSHLFLAERVPTSETEDNGWRPWVIDLPGNDKAPGSETKVPGPFQMMMRILEIIIEFMEKAKCRIARIKSWACRSHRDYWSITRRSIAMPSLCLPMLPNTRHAIQIS